MEAAAVREAHLGHERQLKAVGLLFGLAAVLPLLIFVALVLPHDSGGPVVARQTAGVVAASAIALCAASVLGALAFGYRTLAPWVKFVGTPVSMIGLLAFPFGTLVNAYVLYLVWCAKGRRVMAPDYAEIIRATPLVRYKSSVGDFIALAVLVLLFAGFAASLLFF